MTATDVAPDVRQDRGFFGQPRVLANLFGVELWERFSFYGMQGILLIYLYYSAARGGLAIDQDTATSIVGAYGGSVYLATVIGAWLADRLFGPEKVLFYSAVLVMFGHICLAALWTRLGHRQPSTPVKFGAGTIVMGLAFLLFLPFAGGGPNSVPLLGLVGILFVFTIAELLLSPVGLSSSTKLAPEAFRTQMVALFFLSVALGTAMSGTLAGYYDEQHEVPYFGILGAVAIVIGAVIVALNPLLRRLMGGVR
jgi:dipeptide/tripeptide permease